MSDLDLFEECLISVTSEWVNSCEHYLTNPAMNRIAWLGQASLSYKYQIPSKFCGGFNLLSDEEKDNANNLAYKYLCKWLENYDLPSVTLEEAMSIGRQVAIY